MTDNVKNINSLHYGVYYDSKMLYGIDPRACTIKHYELIIFDVRSKLISSPKQDLTKEKTLAYYELCLKYRGRIFSHVQPFYELAVSNLDRSMHRSLWV